MEPVNYIALLLENIDTLGSEFTTATYGVLATSLSPILYSFFILYLIFWGFQYWQGYGESNVSSFVFRLFRIAIIFSMATSWGVIQTFAYDVIRQAPSQITTVLLSNIVNTGQGSMSAGTIERDLYDFYRFGYRALEEKPNQSNQQAQPQQTATSPSPTGLLAGAEPQNAGQDAVPIIAAAPFSGKQILNITIYLCTTLFIGSALAIVIFAKLTLWLCLSLAPVFIALLMFKAPSKYFTGWLNILVQSIIIPIFLYAFLAFYFIGIKDIVIAFAVMLNKPETYQFDVAAPIALVSICGFLLIAKIIPMISQIASNTQSITLNAASSKMMSFIKAGSRTTNFNAGPSTGSASATSNALNTGGGPSYGNPRDHAALDAQERQAAARRQKRNL